MTEPTDRRATDTSIGDTGRILSILYTLIFGAMVAGLFLLEIPAGNKDTINQLVGIMSAIQLAIIGFHFGGSKSAEISQRAGVLGRAQADAVLQEIAKAVPTVLAPASPSAPVKVDDMNVSAAGNVIVNDNK